MSRAFVRESDDAPDLPIARPNSARAAGSRNYLTSQGADRLRAELTQNLEIDRPYLLASKDPEAKRQLAALDQRIEQLEESLRTAEIVAPPADFDVVVFGAKVTVRDQAGEESTYRIVGADEIDATAGRVSGHSPIGKALLQRRRDEEVRVQLPDRAITLRIVAIGAE